MQDLEPGLEAPQVSGPLILDNLAILGTASGSLHAVNLASTAADKILWSKQLDGPLLSTPAVLDGIVLAATQAGTLWLFQADNGDYRGKGKISGTPQGPLAILEVAGKKKIGIPTSAGEIILVDFQNSLDYEKAIPEAGVKYFPEGAGEYSFGGLSAGKGEAPQLVFATRGGRLFSQNSIQQTLFKSAPGRGTASIMVLDTAFIVALDNGRILALDRAGGELLASFQGAAAWDKGLAYDAATGRIVAAGNLNGSGHVVVLNAGLSPFAPEQAFPEAVLSAPALSASGIHLAFGGSPSKVRQLNFSLAVTGEEALPAVAESAQLALANGQLCAAYGPGKLAWFHIAPQAPASLGAGQIPDDSHTSGELGWVRLSWPPAPGVHPFRYRLQRLPQGSGGAPEDLAEIVDETTYIDKFPWTFPFTYYLTAVDAYGNSAPTLSLAFALNLSGPLATSTFSPTASASPSPSQSATVTFTRTATPTFTSSPSSSETETTTSIPSITATDSETLTATETQELSSTPTATDCDTRAPTLTFTVSPTPMDTRTTTGTRTYTPTASPTPSATPSSSPSYTASGTSSPTATRTASQSLTPSFSPTRTSSRTASRTASATATVTPSSTASPSNTPTRTATATPVCFAYSFAVPSTFGNSTWDGNSNQAWTVTIGHEAPGGGMVSGDRPSWGWWEMQDFAPLMAPIYEVRLFAVWRGNRPAGNSRLRFDFSVNGTTTGVLDNTQEIQFSNLLTGVFQTNSAALTLPAGNWTLADLNALRIFAENRSNSGNPEKESIDIDYLYVVVTHASLNCNTPTRSATPTPTNTPDCPVFTDFALAVNGAVPSVSSQSSGSNLQLVIDGAPAVGDGWRFTGVSPTAPEWFALALPVERFVDQAVVVAQTGSGANAIMSFEIQHESAPGSGLWLTDAVVAGGLPAPEALSANLQRWVLPISHVSAKNWRVLITQGLGNDQSADHRLNQLSLLGCVNFGVTSATPSSTSSPTRTPTGSATPTATRSATRTHTATSTFTPSSSRTPTRTMTRSVTATFSMSPSPTPSSTRTPTPTRLPTCVFNGNVAGEAPASLLNNGIVVENGLNAPSNSKFELLLPDARQIDRAVVYLGSNAFLPAGSVARVQVLYNLNLNGNAGWTPIGEFTGVGPFVGNTTTQFIYSYQVQVVPTVARRWQIFVMSSPQGFGAKTITEVQLFGCADLLTTSPTPSRTPTPTSTSTGTRTPTRTATPSRSPTNSRTPTSTVTPTSTSTFSVQVLSNNGRSANTASSSSVIQPYLRLKVNPGGRPLDLSLVNLRYWLASSEFGPAPTPTPFITAMGPTNDGEVLNSSGVQFDTLMASKILVTVVPTPALAGQTHYVRVNFNLAPGELVLQPGESVQFSIQIRNAANLAFSQANDWSWQSLGEEEVWEKVTAYEGLAKIWGCEPGCVSPPTQTVTRSYSPTHTLTMLKSATPSRTLSSTPTNTPSPTDSQTPTQTPTLSVTPPVTPTAMGTACYVEGWNYAPGTGLSEIPGWIVNFSDTAFVGENWGTNALLGSGFVGTSSALTERIFSRNLVLTSRIGNTGNGSIGFWILVDGLSPSTGYSVSVGSNPMGLVLSIQKIGGTPVASVAADLTGIANGFDDLISITADAVGIHVSLNGNSPLTLNDTEFVTGHIGLAQSGTSGVRSFGGLELSSDNCQFSTATLTFSESPTFTATMTETPSPTATVTPDCMPAPMCAACGGFLCEDWETGYQVNDMPVGWEQEAGANNTIQVVPELDNFALHMPSSSIVYSSTSLDYTDFEVDVFAGAGGRGTLLARVQEADIYFRYQFKVIPGVSGGVALEARAGNFASTIGTVTEFIPDPACPAFRMRLVVDGFNLRGYINNQLVASGTDPFASYPLGRIGMESVGGAAYDNLRVNNTACGPLPSPTPTFTATGTPSSTPTSTATPDCMPAPLCVACDGFLCEDWETGYQVNDMPVGWEQEAGANNTIQVVPELDNFALHMPSSSIVYSSASLDYTDFEVDVFAGAGGRGTLLARVQEADIYFRYQFKVIPGVSGGVALEARAGNFASTIGTVTEFIPDPACPAFRMRLVVDGFNLRGYINNQLVASGTDPFASYPLGRIGMESVGGAAYDNLRVNNTACGPLPSLTPSRTASPSPSPTETETPVPTPEGMMASFAKLAPKRSLLAPGQNLLLAPNPAARQALAAFRQAKGGSARLALYSLGGAEVLRKDLAFVPQGEGAQELDLGSLASGLYILVHFSDEGLGLSQRGTFKCAVVK